jgi:uncharacterized protein (DUF2336 family)
MATTTAPTLREFQDAIHALFADPTRNVDRYLAASRAIEDARAAPAQTKASVGG